MVCQLRFEKNCIASLVTRSSEVKKTHNWYYLILDSCWKRDEAKVAGLVELVGWLVCHNIGAGFSTNGGDKERYGNGLLGASHLGVFLGLVRVYRTKRVNKELS